MVQIRGASKSYLWLIIDNLWAIFVVGVLVVFYWRGTWVLLDLNLYPDDQVKTVWICVALGNGGLFLGSVLQEPLTKLLLSPPKESCLGKIVAGVLFRLLIYVMSFLSVCHWRGIWNALDHYTGKTDQSYLIGLAVGQGILWLLRSSRLVAAPPCLVAHDTGEGAFNIGSRFGTKPKNLEHYILDHLLSVVIIWNSVVLVWRGVWGLGDNHFYPDSTEQSCWCSLACGFGCLFIAIPLQMIGNKLYRVSLNHDWNLVSRVLLEDLLFLVANFGVVHHWRGVWLMQDIYILAGEQHDPSLSPGISHLVGFLGLGLLFVSMSNVTVGSYITGSSSAHSGCLLDNRYFRTSFAQVEEDGDKAEENANGTNVQVYTVDEINSQNGVIRL